MNTVKIQKTATKDANVSSRNICYDVFVNGVLEKTFRDINDALDFAESQKK